MEECLIKIPLVTHTPVSSKDAIAFKTNINAFNNQPDSFYKSPSYRYDSSINIKQKLETSSKGMTTTNVIGIASPINFVSEWKRLFYNRESNNEHAPP